jgi:proteasome lid subunit RPN8/RPN11
MSKRRFRSTTITKIKIAKNAYQTLLALALSRFEYCAVCAANSRGIIVEVVQIPNRSNKPHSTYWWEDEDWDRVCIRLRKSGLYILAEAHSHPNKKAKLRPSLADHRASEPGYIAIIVKSLEMGAWRYGRTYRQTLENRIELVIV